jgi:hypothetical protein
MTLFLGHATSLAHSRCHELFISVTSVTYNQNVRQTILTKPESLLDKKIVGKENNLAFPFTIRSRKTVSAHLSAPLEDIHVLSNSQRARSRIFGSATRRDELTTDLMPRPLSLDTHSNPTDGLFVEVGVDVFTLENDERRYVYWTSNAHNYASAPYEFRADLIEQIEKSGQKVSTLESIHSHPSTLFPTIDDKLYFIQELVLIRTRYPNISFKNWKMLTTTDTDATLHEVQLNDWLN